MEKIIYKGFTIEPVDGTLYVTDQTGKDIADFDLTDYNRQEDAITDAKELIDEYYS